MRSEQIARLRALIYGLARNQERLVCLNIGPVTVLDLEGMRAEMLRMNSDMQDLVMEVIKAHGIESIAVFRKVRDLDTGAESERVAEDEPVRAGRTQKSVLSRGGRA